MSPSQMRARLSFVAIGAGVMALMLGMMSVWQDSQREARPDVSGQVLPQWSEQARQAERLELRTRDQHIVLTRTEEGQWVMPSRGGYPVLSSVMGELDEFLTGLQYRAALTQDPEKYQRLGLVPPQDGGAGLNLILRDQKDEALVNVILGTGDNNDGLYLRSANSR